MKRSKKNSKKNASKKTKTKKAAPNAAKKEAQKAASTKPQMRGEWIDIRERFLDCAIQQLVGANILNYNDMEGFPFKFGRVPVTEKLTAMLTPDALAQDRDRLLCIVAMLGRIARHVNSTMLPRIIKLRMDMDRLYSSAADASTAANALHLAGELEKCHDLLLAELELMDADARKAALQAVWHSQTATKGDEGNPNKEDVADDKPQPLQVTIDGLTKNGEEVILELLKGALKESKPEKFITGKRLAEIFGVSDETISNWINQKVTPPEGFLKAYFSKNMEAMLECAKEYRSKGGNIINQKGNRVSLPEAEAEMARLSQTGQR